MMAGNYDYPRAGSTSRPSAPPAPPERRPEITARLRHLRELLDSDRVRDRQRSAIETLDAELLQMSAEPISSRLERRRRGLEAQLRANETPEATYSDADGEPPESVPSTQNPASRSRRRPARPSDRIQRRREQSSSPAPSELESIRTRSRLIDPLSTLSPLGERPVPRIGSADLLTREYSGEAEVNFENRWRAKRRKLDADDTRGNLKKINYGHFGQVVPGQLNMEIVSCDGGQYMDPNGNSSWPDNVLQNDSSVYCTKSDRCNMVLRHQGEAPFTLKKVVIKAPKTGFDAAIQEGMIFVAMDRSDLLARTAQYQIQYSPHRHRSRRSERREHAQIRLTPTHQYYNSVRSPLRTLDETVSPQLLYRDGVHSDALLVSSHLEQAHGLAPNFTVQGIPRVPEFRVTTEFEDKSDNGSEVDNESSAEDPNAAAEEEFERMLSLHNYHVNRARDLYRHHRAASLDGEDSGNDTEDWDENSPEPETIDTRSSAFFAQDRAWHHARGLPYPPAPGNLNTHRWYRRRVTPSRIEVTAPPSTVDARNGGNASTLNNPSSANGAGESSSSKSGPQSQNQQESNPLIPHATFFIRKEKNMVAIKFDPPVSGKFILIKLWAPCPNANIDIQSVIAYGYAGPRFFPALSVR